MIEYALRGAPIRGISRGRLYASFPTFLNFCEALRSGSYFPDVPLLVREDGGEWRLLEEVARGAEQAAA